MRLPRADGAFPDGADEKHLVVAPANGVFAHRSRLRVQVNGSTTSHAGTGSRFPFASTGDNGS